MRACVEGEFGVVQVYDPVLAIFEATAVGYVTPPSVESSIVTLRLKLPLFVHVMFVDSPMYATPAFGATEVSVSAVLSAVVSRNQPISRSCCRVRSPSIARPELMFGSIKRFGEADMSKCEIEEPAAKDVGV